MTEETVEQLEARIKELKAAAEAKVREEKERAAAERKANAYAVAVKHADAIYAEVEEVIAKFEGSTKPLKMTHVSIPDLYNPEKTSIKITATHDLIGDVSVNYAVHEAVNNWSKVRSVSLEGGYKFSKTIMVKKDGTVSYDKFAELVAGRIAGLINKALIERALKKNSAPAERLQKEFSLPCAHVTSTTSAELPVYLSVNLSLNVTEAEARALLNAIKAIKEGK